MCVTPRRTIKFTEVYLPRIQSWIMAIMGGCDGRMVEVMGVVVEVVVVVVGDVVVVVEVVVNLYLPCIQSWGSVSCK